MDHASAVMTFVLETLKWPKVSGLLPKRLARSGGFPDVVVGDSP